MKSVIQQDYDRCYECGSVYGLEEHHCFGASNRKWSEKYGLKVRLCHYCHNEPPMGVHHNKAQMDKYHRIAQEAFERTHSREEFMRIFGRNYL